MKKDNKGITLMVLVITIVVLMIITAIVLKYAREAIEIETFQNTKTTMLLIEAKTKEYVENANYDLGIKPEEATEEMKEKANNELKGTKVTAADTLAIRLPDIGIRQSDIDSGKVYKFTSEELQSMNIKGVQSDDKKGWYVVVYDIEAVNVEVYHTYGVKLETGEIKYNLDDIRDIF